MELHENQEIFNIFASLSAKHFNISIDNIKRDYFLVRALSFLVESEYGDKCVFKGGTSISKCYPNAIERFSEDIDLTYIPNGDNNKEIEKNLKSIEKIMSRGMNFKKIEIERNQRNKSSYIWYENENNRIKLEIGSSVRPDPYSKKELKSYILEYLEISNYYEDIKNYKLHSILINVLNIERTFIDKIFAVKRHAICGTITEKTRHIYDVVRLVKLKVIQKFLENKDELKTIVKKTKETDYFYLEKRKNYEYDSLKAYDFSSWKDLFMSAKSRYVKLHETILYTDQQQKFDEAIKTFEYISKILEEIGE